MRSNGSCFCNKRRVAGQTLAPSRQIDAHQHYQCAITTKRTQHRQNDDQSHVNCVRSAGRRDGHCAIDRRRAIGQRLVASCRRVTRVMRLCAMLCRARRAIGSRAGRRVASPCGVGRGGRAGRWRSRRGCGRWRRGGWRRRRSSTDLGAAPCKVVLKVVHNLVRKRRFGVGARSIAKEVHDRLGSDAKSRSPAANVKRQRGQVAKELAFGRDAIRLATRDACGTAIPHLTHLCFVRIAARCDVRRKLCFAVKRRRRKKKKNKFSERT
jgi:hypothetical protein